MIKIINFFLLVLIVSSCVNKKTNGFEMKGIWKCVENKCYRFSNLTSKQANTIMKNDLIINDSSIILSGIENFDFKKVKSKKIRDFTKNPSYINFGPVATYTPDSILVNFKMYDFSFDKKKYSELVNLIYNNDTLYLYNYKNYTFKYIRK